MYGVGVLTEQAQISFCHNLKQQKQQLLWCDHSSSNNVEVYLSIYLTSQIILHYFLIIIEMLYFILGHGSHPGAMENARNGSECELKTRPNYVDTFMVYYIYMYCGIVYVYYQTQIWCETSYRVVCQLYISVLSTTTRYRNTTPKLNIILFSYI